MDTKKIIGMNLKYLRYKAKLSQEEFYNQLGLSYQYLASVERGEINVTINFLDNLAEKLKVSLIDLITFDESKIIKEKRIDSKKMKIRN